MKLSSIFYKSCEENSAKPVDCEWICCEFDIFLNHLFFDPEVGSIFAYYKT